MINTTTTTVHAPQYVQDNEQYIAGCDCSWTCPGHLDDINLCLAAIYTHIEAATSK